MSSEQQIIKPAALSLKVHFWFLSKTITQTCDQTVYIAFLWYVTVTYPTHLSWLVTILMLPFIIFPFFSDMVIKKIGEVKTIMFADIVRAILFLIAFSLLSFDFNFLFIIVIFYTASNIISSISSPALLCIPTKLANGHELDKINGFLNSRLNIARVVGPALAVLFVSVKEIKFLLSITALAYVFSALQNYKALSGIVADKLPKGAYFKEKWLALKSDYVVSGFLIIIALSNLCFFPLQILIPLYTKYVFHGAITSFATMQSVRAVGAIIGSMFIVFIRFNQKQWVKIFIPQVLTSLCFIFYALSHTYLLSLVALFFMGVFSAFCNAFIFSLFQKTTSNQYLPAIMSMTSFVISGTQPVSIFIAGILMKVATFDQLALFLSVAMLGVAFLTLSIPNYKKY